MEPRGLKGQVEQELRVPKAGRVMLALECRGPREILVLVAFKGIRDLKE